MDGGRKKWLAEGRDLSTDKPTFPREDLQGEARRTSRCARSCRKCRRRSPARARALVDVRSPQEFTGEILAPPGLPETCQRGGHIPGAKSIPWAKACNDDGTFKSVDELKALYGGAGHHRRQAGHRLLPHRRAFEPHVVRAEVPARLQGRARTTTARGPSGATWSARPSKNPKRDETRRLFRAGSEELAGWPITSRPTSSATCITARLPTSTPARGLRAPTGRRKRRRSGSPSKRPRAISANAKVSDVVDITRLDRGHARADPYHLRSPASSPAVSAPLLGLGGGVFLVPFLNLVLGLPFTVAAAISLTTVIATSSTVSAGARR